MSDLELRMILKAIDQASAPIRAVGRAFTDLRQKAGIPELAVIGQRLQNLAGIGRNLLLGGGIFGAGAAGVFYGLKRQIFDVGSEFERLNIQLVALEGSQEAANKASDWIVDFAKRTPLELQDVIQAYAQMKTFGIDPTNGSLQALTDTMAKHGGSAELLQRITLALGQAWVASKLQGQDILQLTQAGIPVWDMLAKATGKNVTELKKLSEKGLLGRKAIQALIKAMGDDAAGASEAYSHTAKGIISNIADVWTQFRKQIGDAAFMDAVKAQLQSLLDTLNGMAADGSLQQMATQIGQFLAAIVNQTPAAVQAIKEFFGELREDIAWLRDNFGWLTKLGSWFLDASAWVRQGIGYDIGQAVKGVKAIGGAAGGLWQGAAPSLGAAVETVKGAASAAVSRVEGAIGVNITGAPKGSTATVTAASPGLTLSPTLGPAMLGGMP